MTLGQGVETLLKYPFYRICRDLCLCFTVQIEYIFEDCGNNIQDEQDGDGS